MQTYWTSGVMIPVDAKPGERVFYAKEEVDVRIAELEKALREIQNIHLCCFPDSGCDGDKVYEIVSKALMESGQ